MYLLEIAHKYPKARLSLSRMPRCKFIVPRPKIPKAHCHDVFIRFKFPPTQSQSASQYQPGGNPLTERGRKDAHRVGK